MIIKFLILAKQRSDPTHSSQLIQTRRDKKFDHPFVPRILSFVVFRPRGCSFSSGDCLSDLTPSVTVRVKWYGLVCPIRTHGHCPLPRRFLDTTPDVHILPLSRSLSAPVLSFSHHDLLLSGRSDPPARPPPSPLRVLLIETFNYHKRIFTEVFSDVCSVLFSPDNRMCSVGPFRRDPPSNSSDE